MVGVVGTALLLASRTWTLLICATSPCVSERLVVPTVMVFGLVSVLEELFPPPHEASTAAAAVSSTSRVTRKKRMDPPRRRVRQTFRQTLKSQRNRLIKTELLELTV